MNQKTSFHRINLEDNSNQKLKLSIISEYRVGLYNKYVFTALMNPVLMAVNYYLMRKKQKRSYLKICVRYVVNDIQITFYYSK